MTLDRARTPIHPRRETRDELGRDWSQFWHGVFWRWISGAENNCFWPFWEVLGAYKRHTHLHIGLLSPQICTDLRGVKNPWKIGGNPPIGRKEYTLFEFNEQTCSLQLSDLVYLWTNRVWQAIHRTGRDHIKRRWRTRQTRNMEWQLAYLILARL